MNSIHTEPHPEASKTVQIDIDRVGTGDFVIEDWYDRVTGGSWMADGGNFAAMNYAIRGGLRRPPLPTDDEVVYGKVQGFGHIVHVSELPERGSRP